MAAEGNGEQVDDAKLRQPAPSGTQQGAASIAADRASRDDENTAEELGKIEHGERWLIGVGIAAFVMNTLMAFIYWQQLTQMRIATEASTRASETAIQSLEYSNSEFERTMTQTVDQTVSQFKATQATQLAAVAAEHSAQVARDALVQVQRAVMSADELTLLRNQDSGTVDQFSFVIRWRNLGATPTKNLIMHHSWLPIPDLPPNFDYPDLWAPGEPHTPTPAFAGPQKNLDTAPLDVPPETIRAVQARQTNLYFWGWTRYRDVFKGTPEHISEYCVVLKGFRGNPFDTDPSHPVLLILENCKTHNCYDDECKAR